MTDIALLPLWPADSATAESLVQAGIAAAPRRDQAGAVAVLPQAGAAQAAFAAIRDALFAGDPVACFGYPAETAEDAQFLARLAREKGVRYAVHPLDAWTPAVVAIDAAIRGGRLGQLQFLQIELTAPRKLLDLLAAATAIALRLGNVAMDRIAPAIPQNGAADMAGVQFRLGECDVQVLVENRAQQETSLRFRAAGTAGKASWDGQALSLQPAGSEPEQIAVAAGSALRLAVQAFQSGHDGSGPALDHLIAVATTHDDLPAVTRYWESRGVFVHGSAVIDPDVTIGANSKIWHFSHILSRVQIGRKVNIGQNVVIGPDVSVGDNCKIQNNVSLYKGVTLEQGVFCGPSCVFTNVNNPRAEIERKSEYLPTLVKRGASIGANATIVCGHTLGAYCFIAAGAVVTANVPDYALMAGVPARRIGWMSRAGHRLGADLTCPAEGRRYRETAPDCLEDITG